MWRNNPQGNRSGDSSSKVKYTDHDTRSMWKPKAKINDGSLDSASGKSDSKIKHTDVDPRTDRKPKAEIDESLDSASFSQNDKSTVPGESNIDDAAFGVDKSHKPTLNALDDVERPKHHVFDICPKKSSSVPKLKAPLHVLNRENRNKQSMKGPNIIILGPGMVLMKGYISSDDQISIVKTCRNLGIGVGGFYQPGYVSGTKLHLQMMCLGKNWDPDTHMYTELRLHDNSKPPGIPEKLVIWLKKTIQDSNEFICGKSWNSDEGKVVPSMSPDICIVNFYNKTGRLGLHQDKDESEKSLKKGLPVVSFSIGDSQSFCMGKHELLMKQRK